MYMNYIKITVIIPVYNQEELIIKAIESIPKRKDIEIIVIDDKSTDNTLKILEQRKDIRLFKNRTNKGVGYTVNKGYDKAKGEYIVLLGSDDYFYPEEFEKCIDELNETDLVYFDVKVNNEDIWELNEKSKYVLCGSYKFMRREFIGKTRCADKKAGEDVPFYNELLAKNPTEKFTHIVVKHYNHPRNGSLTDMVRKGILNE